MSDTLKQLARGAATAAVPLLVSAGGFLGFVTFAGGAVTWAGFHAVGIPVGQAIDAIPDSALIVEGALILVVFALLGLLAVLLAYLSLIKTAEDSARTLYVLLGLALAGGVSAVILAIDGRRWVECVSAIALLILGAGVTSALLEVWYSTTHTGRGRWFYGGGVAIAVLVGASVLLLLDSPLFGAVVTMTGLLPFASPSLRNAASAPRSDVFTVLGAAAALGVLAILVRLDIWLAEDLRDREGIVTADWVAGVAAVLLWAGASAALAEGVARGATRPSTERWPPHGSFYVGCGFLALLLAAVEGVLLRQLWVGASIVLVSGLALVCYRLAHLKGSNSARIGVSIFLSVVAFGALVSSFDAHADPRVQPAAVIRKGDPPGRGIEGLYLTETADDVLLGSAVTRCGGSRAVPQGGRMVAVDKTEVEAVSIGPLQPLGAAAIEAPRMLESLVALTSPAREGDPDGRATAERTHLPAVRREAFVRRLEPARVRPGHEVKVIGSGPGPDPPVRLDGRMVASEVSSETPDGRWRSLTVTIPRDARSGSLAVGCPGGRDGPLLEVARRPVPRILVRPVKGRRGIFRVDGRRSWDPDGRIVEYHWRFRGRDEGDRRVESIAADGSRRGGRVTLEVTDNEKLVGRTSARIPPARRLNR